MIDREHICRAITNAELIEHPWKHYHISGMLDPETINRIDEDRSVIFDKDFQIELVEIFEHQDIRDALHHFEIGDAIPMLEIRTLPPEYRGSIHCDSPSKMVSFVLYIGDNPESDGTKIHEYGGDRKYVTTFPFKNNNALLFKRDDNTFHTYGEFSKPRTSIGITYRSSFPRPEVLKTLTCSPHRLDK